MKKIIALVLMVALCCMSLTGCFGMVGSIQINEDGSGNVKWSEGMTREYLEYNGEKEKDIAEMDEFTYNNIKYYGEVHESSFTNADNFNKNLDLQNEESFKLVQHGKGEFTLLIKLTPEDTKDVDAQIDATGYTPEEREAIEEFTKEIAIVYEIDFPSDVKQTRGPVNGVKIDGKHIVIDLLKMNLEITEAVTLEFTNVEPKNFTDVADDKWYYDAVSMMARGGLVAGMGNNLFNPEGTLTFAEFCQILARAKGLETGEENGYWASKAIAACVKAGYIVDRGEITPANYNVAIPREAAVAAMYVARPSIVKIVKKVAAEDIPDYATIAPEYQEKVVLAYACGITNGVDANKTFLPKNFLKRGEVCQLFYNLNWTFAGK